MSQAILTRLEDSGSTELVGGPGDGEHVKASVYYVYVDKYGRKTTYLATRDRTGDGHAIARPLVATFLQ